MEDKLTFDGAQLEKLLASVDALRDHAPYWKHFLIAALPIFLASLLGLATALFLDWLKTRRENKKSIRERRENELALLSGVNTSIGFNVTALIHTVMQQILPHYQKSQDACAAITALQRRSIDPKQFNDLMHSKFQPVMRRCPILYLEDINFARDLPFLLKKDPELILLSGWIITYTEHLTAVLKERNKLIDLATLDDTKSPDLIIVGRQLEAQASVADAEIINVHQLFQQLLTAGKKITGIIEREYKDVFGPKLKIAPPEMLGPLIIELERIAKTASPDWPPIPQHLKAKTIYRICLVESVRLATNVSRPCQLVVNGIVASSNSLGRSVAFLCRGRPLEVSLGPCSDDSRNNRCAEAPKNQLPILFYEVHIGLLSSQQGVGLRSETDDIMRAARMEIQCSSARSVTPIERPVFIWFIFASIVLVAIAIYYYWFGP